jgi:recombination protein RecT
VEPTHKPQQTAPAVVARNPILDLLKKYEKSIAALVPKHLTGEKMLKFVTNAMNREPKLLQCNPMTLINAVLTAAQLGLEIGPGSAYLLPFRTKKKNAKAPYDCTLVIDYRGKISLALRSGKVLDVDPEIVYSKEKFKIWRGEDGIKRIEHEPMVYKVGPEGEHLPIEEKDRGVAIGAYVVTSLLKGPPKITFMSRIDIMKIKAKSPAADSGPWVTDELEMFKKTVIHRAFKTMPSSAEDFDAMRRAQDIDDRVDIGATLDNVIEYEPEDEDAPGILTSGLEDKIEEQGRQAEAETGKAPEATTDLKKANPPDIPGDKQEQRPAEQKADPKPEEAPEPKGDGMNPPWANKLTMITAFEVAKKQLGDDPEFWEALGNVEKLDELKLNGENATKAFARIQALITERKNGPHTKDDDGDGFQFGRGPKQ